ncbi:MAG: response regulator transcription factor [Agriterribacter sp.]
MISIGIIDNFDDYRSVLQLLLEGMQDMEITFAVKSADEAMIALTKTSIKVCIIDINLPGQSGIDFIKWITASHPGTLCLICTASDSDDKIFQSLEAGAHGYILKSTPPAAIVEAVKELCNGGSPMSNEVARKVINGFSKKQPPATTLNKREQELLELLSGGLTYKEISLQLNTSIETVKRHCFNIYQKLHRR